MVDEFLYLRLGVHDLRREVVVAFNLPWPIGPGKLGFF